ncbi:MAG: T9SS type A sorting domain-containing protein [Flavobacteriales bacterium]|nr:T9SS type A sorting domain-containing protein [Flavobacteriales bacterium]
MRSKLLFGLLLASATAFGQAGANDPTFNRTKIASAWNSVSAMVVQPDGKILVAGLFLSNNGQALRKNIARLNSDGSVDASFYPGSGTDDAIQAMTLQPDGKILIGGRFQSFNGTPRSYLARLNSDGSLDSGFDPGTGASFVVYKFALQVDGKILVGGDFTSYNGTPRNRLARLNSDGSLDLSFDPGSGLNGAIEDMLIQPDGKIMISGIFNSYNGTTRKRMARLFADGSLDLTFDSGTGANDRIRAMALQPDGKFLILGGFTSYKGIARTYVARINNDGSLDPGFNAGSGANYTIVAMALQADGKVLLGGYFDIFNGATQNNIVRLKSNGALDPSFNSGSGPEVSTAFSSIAGIFTIVLQPDDKILIGGAFISYDGAERPAVTRLVPGSMTLSLTTDEFGSETTWELTRENGSPVASGGPYTDGTVMNVIEQIPVRAGCYKFLLHDAGGNGIDGGGYILRDGNGQRIIDANGEFGALSAIDAKICMPVSPLALIAEDCDDLVHSAGEPVKCTKQAGAIAYQFWFFDPHGTYEYRISSTSPKIGSNRIAQLPAGLELNVRVRAQLPDSSYTEFGPACKLMITGPGMAPQELRSLLAEQTSDVHVWPNPVSDGSVQISLDGLSDQLDRVQLDVYDAVGRQSLSTSMPVTNGSLNTPLALENLTNGLYLVRITAGDQIFTSRLMVQQQ